MGRRKKEPESTHRENIALTAEQLFIHKGIYATTMDDIAKEAGYSKATLYVYFTNKEEIVGFLTLKSMKLLHSFIVNALSLTETTKEKYKELCSALTLFQEQYPLYCSLALNEINIDFQKEDSLPIEKEIYVVGEEINHEISNFLRFGIKEGEFSPDVPILQTGFFFWASISGLIQMSINKQEYITKKMHLTKNEFLSFGFQRLYRILVLEDCSSAKGGTL